MRQLPGIRELLIFSYREKIKSRKLDPSKVRPYIAHSSAFEDAQEPAFGPDKIPGPPEKHDHLTLQASVEAWKVERMRKLISTKLGVDRVYNTDIVRVAVDHYLECVGKNHTPTNDV